MLYAELFVGELFEVGGFEADRLNGTVGKHAEEPGMVPAGRACVVADEHVVAVHDRPRI